MRCARPGAPSRRPAAERLLGDFDVLHFSDWMYPPQRAGVRATTIHDLVPLHHPEWTTGRTRAMHGRKYRNAAATCDVVFVNSAYTGPRRRRDARRARGRGFASRIPRRRTVYRPDGPAADLGAPYVLTVATLEPRKNLQVLVEAHRQLGGDLELAVVGAEGWGEQPLLDGPRIRRLGYVSDEELARLYRGAAAVAYPSRFEGFGIPVIEAMACGVPVVVSSHESLDEASGDAAVRADPEDPAAFASGIERALAERERLVELGLAHVERFSWRVRRRDLPARIRGCTAMRGDQEIVVVVRRGAEFLVMRRAPERLGYWSLVAGGLEPDETPREAAQRELFEETGLAGRGAAAARRALVLAPRRPARDPRALRAGHRDGHRARVRRRRARKAGSRRSTPSTTSIAGATSTPRSTCSRTTRRSDAVRAAAGATAMKVGVDTSPLVQTRAGTARHVRGLLGALRDRPGVDLELLSFGGPGTSSRASRVTHSGIRSGLGRRARSLDVLHCTTFRGPARSDVPTVLTVHDLAILRAPEAFPRWHRLYGRAGLAARASRLPMRSSPSRSSAAAETVELAGVPGRAHTRDPARRRLGLQP